MTRRRSNWGLMLGCACLALAAIAMTRPAFAHISLEAGGTHNSRYGDGFLKDGPCGKAGGTRGTNIYTYAPGQTITVSLRETIPHPSYFRFAFDNDGDDAFIEPASILPIDPARKCPDGPGDHCGASDFYNSPAVLPNMDNLNPHLTASLNMAYTWQVTLPDVECTNCTLQVIQVMEDDSAHGPYDPTPGVGVEDIYHQCIDLVLKRPDGGTGTTDAGMGGDGRTPTVDASTGDAPRTDAGAPRDGSTGIDAGSGGAGGGTGGAGTGGTGTGGAGGTGTGGTGTTGGTGGAGTGGTSTTGGTGGTSTTGGSGGTNSGGSAGANTGGSGGTNSGGSAGANAGGSTPPAPTDDGGCTISRSSAHTGAGAAWALLALTLASRRRRR